MSSISSISPPKECLACGQQARHNDALRSVHGCRSCFCHLGCIITLFSKARNNRTLFPPRCDCSQEISLPCVLRSFGRDFIPIEVQKFYDKYPNNRRGPAALRCTHCRYPAIDTTIAPAVGDAVSTVISQAITVNVEHGRKFITCPECSQSTCFRCEQPSYVVDGSGDDSHLHARCRLRCICGWRTWQRDPDSRWLICDCGRELCSVCERGFKQCMCPPEDESGDEEEGCWEDDSTTCEDSGEDSSDTQAGARTPSTTCPESVQEMCLQWALGVEDDPEHMEKA